MKIGFGTSINHSWMKRPPPLITATVPDAFGVADWGISVESALDPDAAAYISAVETADGAALEAGVKTAINDFVVGCKADAIWTAIKASCILAGARTLSGALVPLAGAAPTNVNFVSADYNRKTGLKGDGATKYLDSNRNNNADPQNNQHLAAWVSEQINPSGSVNYCYIGTTVNQIGGSLLGRSGDKTSQTLYGQSRASGLNLNISGAAPTGFHGISRNGETSSNGRAGTATVISTVTSQPPRDELLTAFAAAGAALFSPNRLSFYSIGEALDLAALDTRVSALMTAIDGAIT